MGKNILKNILNKSKEDQSFISVYSNKDNTDLFSIGIVCDFDDDFLLIKKVNPEGYFDGFSIQLMQDVFSIEIDDSYLSKMKSFVKDDIMNLEKETQKLLEGNFRFDEVTESLLDKRILVSINSIYDIGYVGYISDFDGENILLKNIDEYNNEDGYSLFKIMEIDRISMFTAELNATASLA